MIVAGLQIDIAWEHPAENYRRAAVLAARAVAGGARLVALPEMFATGFSMSAERMSAHADETRGFMSELASRTGVWVIGGYAEPGDPLPRNACALFDPDGRERLRYHKIHPFSYSGEDERYAAGSALPTADVDGVRVTAQICYDLRFPEPFRAAAADTDLFVVIANWPTQRRAAWRTLLAARANDAQAYVLGVNRVGEGDGLCYAGDTTLVSPLGDELAHIAEQPGVALGAVSTAEVAAVRDRLPFLADRRPDVYAALDAERCATSKASRD
ncbi:MAG: nitrilase-related carbon-nitrogen hydrolase [Anaerolineae bacterium]